jgi:hypothetical protein
MGARLKPLQYPRQGVSSFRERARDDRDTTLVETMIATLIMVIGLMALAQMLATALQLHTLTRNTEEASRLATVKFEHLAKLNFGTDAAVQITPASPDPLTTNIANHFDSPSPGFTRRWRVTAGPTADTRLVTVQMAPTSGNLRVIRPVVLTSIIRQW